MVQITTNFIILLKQSNMFIIFKLFENIKSFKVDEFSNEILQRIDNNLLINGQINVLNIQDELTLKNKKC